MKHQNQINISAIQYGRAVGFTKEKVDLGAGELIEFFCNADERLNIDEDLGVGHGQEDKGGFGDHRNCMTGGHYDGGEPESVIKKDYEFE